MNRGESTIAVVIAAAGSSTRFAHGDVEKRSSGPQTKKPFVTLGGVPVWKRSLDAVSCDPRVIEKIVVISPDDQDWFKQTYASELASVTVVRGGASRAESVGNGIRAVQQATLVAVHDAARPLVNTASLRAVYDAASQSGAAILATRVASTVKRIEDASADADGIAVAETVPRDNLWLAQTPQVARTDWFVDAYRDPQGPAWVPEPPTDEAELLERCGHRVLLVESTPANFKITTPADYQLAQAFVESEAGRR